MSLKMDSTSLSRIMKGQRWPSEETAEKILLSLGYASKEASLILADHMALNSLAKKPGHFPVPFDNQIFETVFNSYHVLILEGLRLNSSNNRAKQKDLRMQLQLSEEQFKKIIEDLLAAGAIRREGSAIEVVYRNKSTVPLPFTTQKRRHIQKDFLRMATDAIDKVPFEGRDNATLTICLRRKDLEQAKQILKEARKKINSLSEKNQDHDIVYNLCTAIYPVIQ